MDKITYIFHISHQMASLLYRALHINKGERIAGKPDGPNAIIVDPPNSQKCKIFTLWSI